MDKPQEGVVRKYDVRRVDGQDEPGKKHHGCFLFVLDLEHDPHARIALSYYARSCYQGHPNLSDDLNFILMQHEYGTESVSEILLAIDKIVKDYPIPDPAIGNLAAHLQDWAAKNEAQDPLSQSRSNMLIRKWRRLRQEDT